MIRHIVTFLLIYLIYRMVRAIFFPGQKSTRAPRRGPSANQAIDEMVKDPVCGVYVPRRDALRVSSGGETLYFCGPKCREHYLEAKKESAS